MIDRYTRPEMGHIFSLENKYAIWQEIEVLACEAQAELGKIGITKEEAAWIRNHAAFDKDEVDAIEAVTNHDVIAFLTEFFYQGKSHFPAAHNYNIHYFGGFPVCRHDIHLLEFCI